MLQFWKISTNADPLCAAAARSTSVSSFLSVSIARATNVASVPIATLSGLKGWSSEPIGVAFVIFPSSEGVDQVVAADRERVAVAGDDPHREIRARDREAGRDRGRAAVDRVHPVRVHLVHEARRAAD